MNKEANETNEYMLFGIESDIKHIISSFIYRRKEKGFSQKDLADLTGLKQSAIARIESMKLYPRIDTIILIARALDLQINFKRINTGWSELK